MVCNLFRQSAAHFAHKSVLYNFIPIHFSTRLEWYIFFFYCLPHPLVRNSWLRPVPTSVYAHENSSNHFTTNRIYEGLLRHHPSPRPRGTAPPCHPIIITLLPLVLYSRISLLQTYSVSINKTKYFNILNRLEMCWNYYCWLLTIRDFFWYILQIWYTYIVYTTKKKYF